MDNYRVLNSLVDNSTSEALNAPDVNAMREVSDLVRSRADLPKEVIKLITNKLNKRDKKVTLLCLELLEYLTYSCEITLYNQISTKDFLLKMGQILKSHDLGEQVITRACRLIKCWRDLFNKDLHQLFFSFQDNVSKKGIDIPSGYSSPYAHLKGSQPASQGIQTFKPASQSNQKQPLPNSGPKAKLRGDLELIKQNITLVNEMIDSQDPRQNVEQNGSLNDLMPTLKKQETQMQSLIEKLAVENDEALLEMCLQLNDDLQATQDRYQSLKRHMKPKPFRGKAVEDDVIQQINNLDINGSNMTGFQPSIFSETAQALNQGVTKVAFKIPPPGQQQTQLVQQQQQPQQPAVVQKPAVTNILDLLDDDEPAPVVPQVSNQIQQQQPQQQPQLYSNVSNQPTTQVPSTQPTLTQLYNQSATQQQQQQQQQSKYQALNGFGQPAVNMNMNMGYGATMPQQGYGMPQPTGYGMPQPTGYGMPQQMDYTTQNQSNLGGYGGNMGMGMGMGMPQQQQQPMGYGMTSQMGYGNSQPTSFMPSTGMGYGGGLPASSTQPPMNRNGGYGATIPKKDAFDDLDDMFGIAGGSSNTTNASSSVSSYPQQQQQQQQPAKQTVDFDLF